MAKDAKYKGAIAAGILAGSAVGLVAGFMMAPKSGQEIRGDIADKAREGVEAAKDKAGDVKDAVTD